LGQFPAEPAVDGEFARHASDRPDRDVVAAGIAASQSATGDDSVA